MRHKTPKELAQVPIIAGLELKKVVFIVGAGLMCIFLFLTNLFLALLFPFVVGINIYLANKYKKEGELLSFIKYSFGSKAILFDHSVKELIK